MRKFNSVFVALVFAALTAFLAAGSAEAFCVYNKTDITIHVVQTKGGAFKKNIPPGGKECCDWQNKDCNPEGKKDSTVRFSVSRHDAVVEETVAEGEGGFCYSRATTADGRLEVVGSKGNYRCEAHSTP